MNGISVEASALLASCDVIDMHVDGFIWKRVFGYDLHRRHGLGLFGGHFYSHLDFPRAAEGGLSAAMWSITTNPLRTAAGRWRTFQSNLNALEKLCTRGVRIATTAQQYRQARAAGDHVCLPAIQGGNAIDAAPEGPASIRDRLITRVTLIHLSNSKLGVTSSPAAGSRRAEGLSAAGIEFVRRLEHERIFVDLAHINPPGFWDAVREHDPTLPLLVTHTGVDGVRPHWRNLDDAQIKAIANSGGVIGIIFHPGFLRPRGMASEGQLVLEHMEHVIQVAGEDFVGLGSDLDGAISPPSDIRDGALAYGRLVQGMLDRGWSEARIRAVLGGNFLRAFEVMRG